MSHAQLHDRMGALGQYSTATHTQIERAFGTQNRVNPFVSAPPHFPFTIVAMSLSTGYSILIEANLSTLKAIYRRNQYLKRTEEFNGVPMEQAGISLPVREDTRYCANNHPLSVCVGMVTTTINAKNVVSYHHSQA